MTAQQLKASILQLAIQGKLVPQNPTDEPASVLLKKIKAEKDALVKAGKIKKDKHESVIVRNEDGRYFEKKDGKTTDITDEIPFDVPDTWGWCRLKSICSSLIDGDHQPPPQTSSGIPFLVISNVSEGLLSFQKTRFVPQEYYETLSESRIPCFGDVLITVTGSYGIPIYVNTTRQFCFQRHIALLKTIETNNVFLSQWLQAPLVKRYFDEKATGVAQKTLALGVLRDMLLPLPPLEEQKRIVAKIEELLPHVEEYGKAETELSKLNAELPEQLKKSILQWAIQGRLVPQDPADEPASELLKRIKAEKAALIKSGKLNLDKHESVITRDENGHFIEKKDGKSTDITDEIPFDIPETWAWVRLFSITIFLHRGKSPKYSDIRKYPMFAQKCNKKDGIHMENAQFCNPDQYNGFQKEYQLQNSDVVINSTGTGTLGRVGIFYKKYLGEFESTVPDSHVTLVRGCQPFVIGEYLFACFRAPFYQNAMLQNADGSTNQKELYTKVIENYLLPLPPLSEQKRIVEKIEKLMSALISL